MPVADVLVVVLAVVMTVTVVVVVIGLHVWGAIQDAREEEAMRSSRREQQR
jgi:hypothetical protein